MPQARLKSSFIYLANAVNDLRGNWSVLALVLTPWIIGLALCWLPDALRIQSGIQSLEPGAQNIVWHAAAMPSATPASIWQPFTLAFAVTLQPIRILIAALALAANLVVLCALARIRSGERELRLFDEARLVYRRAIDLAPAFLWVALLRWIVQLIGLALLVIPFLILYVWLFFAQIALVFDGRRGGAALLYSQALTRGRFFPVAIRILVFLAVLSGYDAWSGFVFVIVGRILGPVGTVFDPTGFVFLLVEIAAIAVGFLAAAFILAADVRLYQDLKMAAVEAARAPDRAAMPPTAPLAQAGA